MASVVLIADGDIERGKAIEEVCLHRGWATHRVDNGASALESALSEVPDVLVAPFNLPLIEATKLSDILRANPRTESIHLLFLKNPDAPNIETDFRDVVVSEDVSPDEIATSIAEVLTKQERMGEMKKEATEEQDVKGQLSQISLPDLLQLFHLNRKTGTIEMRRDGDPDEEGSIFLRDGDIVDASIGVVEGEKALYRLLAWNEGAFSFSPNESATGTRIQTPTRTLLMEGMRQIDEWEELRGSLPPLDSTVSLRVSSSDLPNIVHPLTQEVLLLLEIYSRVQDVIDHCSFPDYQVLRTLQVLVEREMVALKRGVAEEEEPAVSADFFSAPQARRLRDWLGLRRDRQPGRRDAKILVAASSHGAMENFVRHLRTVPGIRTEGDFAGGSFNSEDLAGIARLPVDSEVGLEFIQVPDDPSMVSMWPVLAYGSLACIFVIDAPVADSYRALAPLAQVLSNSPRG